MTDALRASNEKQRTMWTEVDWSGLMPSGHPTRSYRPEGAEEKIDGIARDWTELTPPRLSFYSQARRAKIPPSQISNFSDYTTGISLMPSGHRSPVQKEISRGSRINTPEALPRSGPSGAAFPELFPEEIPRTFRSTHQPRTISWQHHRAE